MAQQVIDAQATADLAARLVQVSEAFVGAPYAVSPLGEGRGRDTDPRMRFDAFDCTTFVETTIALALAENLDEARQWLDVIRYRGGRPDFLTRRHFPGAEWLPELTRLGFLQDITREVGGERVVYETKALNEEVWERRKRPTVLELPAARIPRGVFGYHVWPLDVARDEAEKIPPGTILNLVRVDFPSVPVRISHQGLVIVKDGKRYLRHAADRMYHSVVDEPLDGFLARMQKYRKWPVAGIHLTRILAPTRGVLNAHRRGTTASSTPAPEIEAARDVTTRRTPSTDATPRETPGVDRP